MRATFKGEIDSFKVNGGDVTIEFKTNDGSVETKNIAAKSAAIEGTLTVKKLAAQGVRMGSKIKIEVTFAESFEGEE
jgi:hypothetical protein